MDCLRARLGAEVTLHPREIHAQASSVVVPANTPSSSSSSSLMLQVAENNPTSVCTIQDPGYTSTLLDDIKDHHYHSTAATYMQCENGCAPDNMMMVNDLSCGNEYSTDTTTTMTTAATTGTSTTGEEEVSCSKKQISCMPLALDDPLRANLLVVGHIALGELWATDRNIVEPALKRLSDLCTEKKTADAANNRTAFLLIKGYAIIVEVMNLWRTDRKIQYLSCLVVLNIAEGGADDLDKNDDDNDAGLAVMEAVVAAMKAFPAFFPVQLCGCGALTSLCRTSKQNAHHLVHNLKGIETIMCAVQRYPNATNLQVWARWCLQGILQWEDYRKAFLDAWVRSTLDDALFEKLESPLRPVVPPP